MNKLLQLRERCNLTQEGLADKSGISVRTIQRLEAGQAPKGYTLRALAAALGVNEAAFSAPDDAQNATHLKWCKLINLCALPLLLFPPLNVLVPLAIIFAKKQDCRLARQLISLQLIWTLIAGLLLVVVMMLHDWLGVKSQYTMLIPIVWLLAGAVMVIRNAIEMAGNEQPRIQPDLTIF
jgi:transcriptional regulator with XRE-family HTH domain